MHDPTPTYADLAERLAAAEEALDAIRTGAVDAVVVSTQQFGTRIYTLSGADEFYRVLVEQMPEGAAAVEPDGLVLYANGRLADLLGRPLSQVIGSNLADFTTDTCDRNALLELVADGASAGTAEVRLGTPHGRMTDVSVSVRTLSEDATRCVVMVDLTHRIRAEAELRAAEERFRSAFDSAPIGMALLDGEGHVERVNRALCAILGLEVRDLLERPLPWLAGREGGLARLLDLGPTEVALDHLPGPASWVAVDMSAVRDGAGAVRQVVVQVQDVSERRRAEEALRYVADHDGLTGLVNRRGFELAMEQHLALAARYGGHGALIMIDVDHFKYINDSRGHNVGDLVLKALADALGARLRASDVFARLGGDEFAILIPSGDATGAVALARQLVAAAAELQIAELVGMRRLTVSAGVSSLGAGGRTVGELMALADLALYDAKEAGRNTVAVYDPDAGGGSGTEHRMTWLTRIKTALDERSLVIHRQPIIDLASGDVVLHELLIRMPELDGGVAAAAEWFDVAERYDLATAIDELVFDFALSLLGEGRDAPGVTVNVSGTSIGRAGLLDHYQAGFRRSGVDPGRVTFEITETAAFANLAGAARFAEELHGLGCRLALDDFGAGYGSFYYLKHLPFDDVKIDGEFVRNSCNDRRDRAIISAMVAVARAMGRRTVAESVEDAATMDLLRSHGVDLAQGYFVGRPEALVARSE
ncbi:MAG TPA: EAL domain-containing protein [Acidimicrobiales bacterium]|nr:EAL domain-containing protein [Acidimicrobiales bacterium]